MTTPPLPLVMLTHPTDPALSGPVEFALPNAYTRVAIGRRAVEIVNTGRRADLPRLAVTELPYEEYSLAYKLATLEFVIVRAPKGLYGSVGGKPVLMPGILTEFEDSETDGTIRMLYDAYVAWRESFRRYRAGHPEGNDPQPDGAVPGAGGDPEQPQPAGGAGDSSGGAQPA